MSGDVDYQEPISIRVGRFLLSKGFGLASPGGMVYRSPIKTEGFGILHKEVPDSKLQKYLPGLFRQRRALLGVIWFNQSVLGADERNWLLEMNGHEYVELVKQLAEEMASIFSVKIRLRLISESPVYENYPSDFD